VQAGPPDFVLLDDRDPQPGGTPVEGGGIAARTTTNYDDVVLINTPGPPGLLVPPGLIGRRTTSIDSDPLVFTVDYGRRV
jgi:hypothetical protein